MPLEIINGTLKDVVKMPVTGLLRTVFPGECNGGNREDEQGTKSALFPAIYTVPQSMRTN